MFDSCRGLFRNGSDIFDSLIDFFAICGDIVQFFGNMLYFHFHIPDRVIDCFKGSACECDLFRAFIHLSITIFQGVDDCF
ncbi:Uncharacterised protein [Chlamydia trachomatis]|nr:Uncharacterised protein [Chlamydia trachomatis]